LELTCDGRLGINISPSEMFAPCRVCGDAFGVLQIPPLAECEPFSAGM